MNDLERTVMPGRGMARKKHRIAVEMMRHYPFDEFAMGAVLSSEVALRRNAGWSRIPLEERAEEIIV